MKSYISVIQTMGLRVTGTLLRFLVVIAISRQLGPQEFGIYAFVVQILVLSATLAIFGADQYLLKIIPYHNGRGESVVVNACLSSVTVIVALLGSLIIIFFAFGIIYLDVIPERYVQAVRLGAVMLVPMIFLSLLNTILRSNHKPVLSQLFENIIYPSILLMLWYGLINIGIGRGLFAVDAIWVSLSAYIISGCIGVVALRQYVKSIRPTKINAVFATFKSLIPLFSFVLLFQIFSRAPSLAIGYVLKPDELALYFAASRVAEFIEFPLGIVTVVYCSKYALLGASDLKEKQRILNIASIMLFVSSITIFVAFVFGADYVFSIFGKGMEGAKSIFMILGLGYAIASLTGFVDFALIVGGYARLVNYSLVATLLLMLLMVFLMPITSASDMAWIFTICWMFNKYVMSYLLWKKLKLSVIPIEVAP